MLKKDLALRAFFILIILFAILFFVYSFIVAPFTAEARCKKAGGIHSFDAGNNHLCEDEDGVKISLPLF